MMKSFSGVDFQKYAELVKYVSNLSALFSDSSNAAIDSRFVEKLFCKLTLSRDISRKDVSFDAIHGIDAGVGIKTFVAGAGSSTKTEKVAEFAKDATAGVFQGLSNEERAYKVTELRNARVLSDSAEMGLNPDEGFYHCLVRRPEFAFVHEEPYQLIKSDELIPTNKFGKKIKSFTLDGVGHVYFTDGVNDYTYNVSKNVLMKKFVLTTGFNSEQMSTPINFDIWESLLGSTILKESFVDTVTEDEISEDFVVLPLYSTQSKDNKSVAAKSGINQWNAGGRVRKFGEAYIPVPRQVHKIAPGFFPERDQNFTILLPSGSQIPAKICQSGSKALMSSPNTLICNWLFASIDGSLSDAEKRLDQHRPYLYQDLQRIGKDSVRVTKTPNGPCTYEISLAPVGAYEEFVDSKISQ